MDALREICSALTVTFLPSTLMFSDTRFKFSLVAMVSSSRPSMPRSTRRRCTVVSTTSPASCPTALLPSVDSVSVTRPGSPSRSA